MKLSQSERTFFSVWLFRNVVLLNFLTRLLGTTSSKSARKISPKPTDFRVRTYLRYAVCRGRVSRVLRQIEN